MPAPTLVPTDLALGWGRMSDSAVLAKIDITQSGRFYYWRVKEFPIPRREIETSSANMHMIPADNDVKRQLEQVREGQLVRIEGFLVDARRAERLALEHLANPRRHRCRRVRADLCGKPERCYAVISVATRLPVRTSYALKSAG